MRWYPVIALLVLLTSCGEQPVFEESKDVDSRYWTYEDSLTYKVSVQDTSRSHNMELMIRHADDYDYENIYLKIATRFPDGKRTEERLSINLAEKSGKWIGKCSGETCRVKVYLLDNFRFPEPGSYDFVIYQETRVDSLAGIRSLELAIFNQTS